MKKIYKYLFIIAFVVLPFLFINVVQADEPATVVNPTGASCSLRSGSTGYCYYEDSNLNSYVSGVVWLDTGDEVTILTDYNTVASLDKNLCSDYYVYTSFYFDRTGTNYYGYYCNANLSKGDVSEAFQQEFKNAGFPESYWEKLAILKQAHPNWIFKAINTGIDFKTAVDNENSLGRSLIQYSLGVNDQGYLNTWSGSYNYYNDTFKAFDGSNWYAANYDTIAYYLDPRNFLTNNYIFQFERLSYDDNIPEEKYRDSVNIIFNNDYLIKYTNDFINGGKESKVSPIYLASLSKQEVGGYSTATTAIAGTYNGMYNFYNIGATSSSNPVYNGLDFAARTDESSLRPWNTEYKAIVGGALWMAREYLSIGQDTVYFKKWDVVSNINSNSGSDYVHQYQTNIQAPSTESDITYKSYNSNGLLDLNFIFYIPVYNNMPAYTALPKKGNPNNYLSNLTINGTNVASFDGAVENYTYYSNSTEVTLAASVVNSNAKVTGLGTFEITSDTTKTIKVTAQNGSVKNYNIKIILTDEALEAPKDIVTTLNNAGIKNNNKYLNGFIVEKDINYIKQTILNANKDAEVTLYNSNNIEKNSGIICTGDKVKITVNDKSKTYSIVIYGDVNGDGKITASDYARIKNTFLKKSTLSGAYSEAADVNKDGNITASDYARVKNTFLGKSSIEQ